MKQEIRDLFLYIAIGIALVTTVLLLAALLPNISHAWFIFVWATAFLFLFVSKMYWRQRKSDKLWVLLAFLLIGHIALYTSVIAHFPDFPTVLFLVSVPLEVMLIATIVKLSLNVMPGRVNL